MIYWIINIIPRRFKVSEPAPTDQMRDITIAAYKAQGSLMVLTMQILTN